MFLFHNRKLPLWHWYRWRWCSGRWPALTLRIVAAPILSTSCMPPFLHTCLWVNKRIILALGGKSISQLAGFEPTRAEPIGFQVQRLNHSATTAQVRLPGKFGNLVNIWHSLAFKRHLFKLMFCYEHVTASYMKKVYFCNERKKVDLDLDRTRTCNPQIRSLVPYPLGHKVFWWLELRTRKHRPVNVATQYHPNLIYLISKLLNLPAIITNILRIWISQKRLLLSSWKWSQHFFDSHASQIRSFRLFNGSEVLCE